MTKIYKTMLSIEGRGGNLYTLDTIKHKGKFWLVPSWLDNPKEGWTAPARIICLSLLPHQKTNFGGCDFLLRNPLPKAVFDGQIPPELEKQYTVHQLPDIRFPLSK